MEMIATLTLNPAIDLFYSVDRMVPQHKVRSHEMQSDPGGGGINVSRVIARLGGTARAHYLAGGPTGDVLDGLLDLHLLVRSRIDVARQTRINTTVHEAETGKEFRVLAPGPAVTADEWQDCLDRLDGVECDYLVASGSLPPGVPEDAYRQIKAIAAKRGMKFVLDTSGPALRKALEGGGIFLMKPSLCELEEIAGHRIKGLAEAAASAMKIARLGLARYVAVTMGADGALLAQASGVTRAPGLAVEVRSTVGAGDSFLAAMVFALANGRDAEDAFRYGMAAGAAAVLNPGTGLCHRDDVERLYAERAETKRVGVSA